MRLANLFCALLTLASAQVAGGDAGAGWEKLSDDAGVTVYQRTEAGSGLISLKGEATIDATVADIAAVMKDNDRAQDWMPLVAGKHDLKAVGPLERIEYTHVAMPWPVTDRYFINSGKAEYLPGGAVRLSIKSVDRPDPAWLESDKVLAVMHYSEFMLTPELGGARTHLTLEINSDPRGLLPSWLVNMAQRSWPREFVHGLTAQLAARGWLHPQALAH